MRASNGCAADLSGLKLHAGDARHEHLHGDADEDGRRDGDVIEQHGGAYGAGIGGGGRGIHHSGLHGHGGTDRVGPDGDADGDVERQHADDMG